MDRETAAHDRFVELARADLDRAYRLAGVILGDRAEAEDATQEAVERAWRRVDTLRDSAQFQAWFDRVLLNVCRDRLRRRRRVAFVPLSGIPDVATPSDPFQKLYDGDQLLRAMSSLSP